MYAKHVLIWHLLSKYGWTRLFLFLAHFSNQYKLTLQTQLLLVDAQADRMTDLTFTIRLVLLTEWDNLQAEALAHYHQWLEE